MFCLPSVYSHGSHVFLLTFCGPRPGQRTKSSLEALMIPSTDCIKKAQNPSSQWLDHSLWEHHLIKLSRMKRFIQSTPPNQPEDMSVHIHCLHYSINLRMNVFYYSGTHWESGQQRNGIGLVYRLHSGQAICNLKMNQSNQHCIVQRLKYTERHWQILGYQIVFLVSHNKMSSIFLKLPKSLH